MKILCEYAHCGPSYVRNGWKKVFEECGHNFEFWHKDKESAFDIFSRVEPDIFLGTTYEVDRAIVKNIKSRPNMKVGLFCSAWSNYVETIKNNYPIQIATENEKEIIKRLKQETGKPDFVFTHITDKYLDKIIGGWKTIDVQPYGILNAADIFDYKPGKYKEEYDCDICFVGGYWGYKSRNIDKYFLPILQKYKVKIFGNQPWKIPQYLGFIDTNEVKDLFASSKICINISEPHSTDLGFDIIERPFKVLASKAFCISDYVDEARDLFTEDELVMAVTQEELEEKIDFFLKNPEQKCKYIENGYKNVIENHTYFNRVGKMLELFKLYDEAEHVYKKSKYNFLEE